MTLSLKRKLEVMNYRFQHHILRTAMTPRDRVIEHHAEWNVTAEPSIMDHIIDWKLRYLTVEDKQLIRQFTIELRVNYADADKNEVMRQAVSQAAVHIMATANLLADGVKPDIACFSDDWFSGKEEINALEDVLGKALQERGESTAQSENISSELMAAVRDSQ